MPEPTFPNTNQGTLTDQSFGTTFQNFVGRAPTASEMGLKSTDDALLPGVLQGIKTADMASKASSGSAPVANPVSSSSGPRSDIADFNAAANNLQSFIGDTSSNSFINDALKATTYSQTDAGKADLEAVRQKLRSVGVLDATDQQQIDSEAQAAGAMFDPLLTEAAQQKKSGEAKALVGAGQRGGLQSTQFSGIAALVPTEGGTFFGQGGELNNIQSAYDRNIQDLQSKKIMAMNAARSAARQAIMTGKREDADIATKLFEQAKSAHNEALSLAQEKVNVVSKVQEMQTARQTFNSTQKEAVFADFSKAASIGAEPDKAMKDKVDSLYGTGFSDQYLRVAKTQKTAADQKTQLSNASDLVDMLSKIPAGELIKVGDTEYSGLQQIDPKKDLFVTTETDASGSVTQVTTKYNTDTNMMEIISALPLGKIGKGFKGTTGAQTSSAYGGKAIKARTPLYDQTSNKYVGDELVFTDGTKQFIDPTGTQSPNYDINNVRRGNAVNEQSNDLTTLISGLTTSLTP